MNPVETHIFKQKEPYKSIMIYVRSVILNCNPNIVEKFSYGIPFYNFNNKPMCYLNILKGTNFLDVAFVQGILLESDFPELKNYKNRKQVRSLQVNSIEEFDEKRFEKLLQKATEIMGKSKKAWFL